MVKEIGSEIPTEIMEVFDFFKKSLKDVKFPDLDGDVFKTHFAEVKERSKEVNKIQNELDQAQSKLEEAQSELRKKALKGIAYAKIYCADDDALLAHIGALSLGHKTKPAKRPKRAKKKVSKENPEEGVSVGTTKVSTDPGDEQKASADGPSPGAPLQPE